MSKYENDLISKGDLLSALCDKYIYDDRIHVLPPDFLVALRETQRFIRDFPTIDHDSLRPHGKWEPVVHGRWICKYDPTDGSTDITCSHCKDTRNIEGCYEGANGESLWDMENYCPHCGAKMEE